ncbi:MAG: hypothetical protein PVSMB6_18460 [Steroidobacteraceae bacterium]
MVVTPGRDSLQSGLLGDVEWALSLEPRDGIIRRVTFRSILVAVEGILGALQRGLLSTAELELTKPEHNFLRHGTGVLAGNGNGTGNVPHPLRLRERIELTAALLARLRPDSRPDFDVTGWHELLSSLDIGERLGHAQDLADLDVTETQLAAAVRGYSWLLDNVVAAAQSGFQEQGEGVNERRALPRASGELIDL